MNSKHIPEKNDNQIQKTSHCTFTGHICMVTAT